MFYPITSGSQLYTYEEVREDISLYVQKNYNAEGTVADALRRLEHHDWAKADPERERAVMIADDPKNPTTDEEAKYCFAQETNNQKWKFDRET